MAWYDINYACGHTGREQLYGKRTARDQYVESQISKLCPDCYLAAQNKAHAAAAVAARASTVGLPDLTGSEKQIQWAETIRAAAKQHLALVVGQYDYQAACNKASLMDLHEVVPSEEELAAFASRVLSQASAKYWIDHRADFTNTYNTGIYLIRRVREERAKAIGAELIGK